MLKKNQSQGIASISLAVSIVVVAAVLVTGVLVWKSSDGRNAASPTPAPRKQQPKKQTTNPTTDAYVGWKDYSNQMYGFALKYPEVWTYEEVPVASPSGANPTEFSLNLKLTSGEKYSETATFEILTSNLAQVTKYYDDYFAQSSSNNVSKAESSLKGKQSVQYDVTNSGVKSKLYLFDVGTKTYAFSSINEELNAQKSTTYWSDFDMVFESLTIQ